MAMGICSQLILSVALLWAGSLASSVHSKAQMAQPNRTIHRSIKSAALPYSPGQSPINERPAFNAGNDLIAVIDHLTNEGWMERRPGWNTNFESTPTTFAAAPSRLFGWQKWDGTFYVMANVVSGGTSTVYKLQVGTDVSFVSILSGAWGDPFDFVISGNLLYFSNGTVARKWDGTTVTNWGIASPTMAPRDGYTGVGVTDKPWTLGVRFVYAYYNTNTDHLSAPSPLLIPGRTGPVTETSTYAAIVARSADAQTTHIKLFRSTDGGDGVFYEEGSIANPALATVGPAVFRAVAGPNAAAPRSTMTSGGSYTGGTFPNYHIVIDGEGTPDTFKWSDNGVTFNATGVAITGAAQALSNGITVTFGATTGHKIGDQWNFSSGRIGLNSGGDDELLPTPKIFAPSNTREPPPAMQGLTEFSGRIWGFKNDTVYFSAAEEIGDFGVEEESFPTNNTFKFDQQVTGIAKAGDGLLLFTPGHVYKITGDSIDSFRRRPLLDHIGTRQRATITAVGSSAAWLDTSGTLRISDGFSQSEFGRQIRSDLFGINHSLASMTFHTDGKRQYLILLDGGNGKVYVFDIDLDIWMPPWIVGGGTIASIETAAGTWDLLLGHSSGKVMKNALAPSPNNYADNGVTYAPSVRTQLISLPVSEKPGFVADLEYISLETDATLPATVSILTDEDPSTGTYTDITANIATPGLRTQGTNLKETWYYHRIANARRGSLKLTWANNSTNFKLYGFDFASQELQK